MSQFRLEIVTPERKFFDEDIDMLIARSVTGDIAILKGHIPLVTPLDIGVIKIEKDGEVKIANLSSGYMEVSKNKTVIVADAAEWPGEVDLERAKKARERAERRIQQQDESTDVERAEIALSRALARIELVERVDINK